MTSNSHFAVSTIVEVPEEDRGRLSSALVDVDEGRGAEDDAAGVPVNIVENRGVAGVTVGADDDVAGAVGFGSEEAAGDAGCFVVMVNSPSPSVRVLALPKSFEISPSLINFLLFFPIFCFLFFLLSFLSVLSPFLDFRLLFAASNLC